MADLERFVRHLVAVIRGQDPGAVHRPIAVSALRRTVLPYRLHRNPLGLTTSDDYDLLVLRLAAEEQGYARTFPPEVADRCREELRSPVPDLDLVEAIGDATIQIGAATLTRLDAALRDDAAAVAVGVEDDAPPPAPSHHERLTPPTEPAPREPESGYSEAEERNEPVPRDAPAGPTTEAPAAGVIRAAEPLPRSPAPVDRQSGDGVAPQDEPRCRFCSMNLPAGRRVVYCPFCGRQQLVIDCPRCGSEIEPGWKHCITCGHAAGAGAP